MPESETRKLAAILAADIAGYSALMGSDEARTVRDLKGHQAVVLPMIGEFGGRIIDTAGDGILAEFSSVVKAVECAVALQDKMVERNAKVEPERRMRYRIGINIGDVIYDESRIYGDGLNIAARLEAMAEPGGIFISRQAYDQVDGKLALSFRKLGPQSLKNILKQVEVFAIDGPGGILTTKTDDSSRVQVSSKPVPSTHSSNRSASRALVVLVPLFAVVLGMGGTYMYLRPVVLSPSDAPSPTTQPTTDENAWLDAARTGTIRSFRQYLDDFPNGVHVTQARQRIKAADEKAWADAMAVGTVEALKQYLEQFPDGTYIAQVKSSMADLEHKAADAKPPLDARRFDGAWVTDISCSNAEGARGYGYRFVAQVKDGNFHGARGVEGKPGWMTLEGKIQSDGTAYLFAKGLTDNSAYTVGNVRPGSDYSYHIQARFEGSSATGKRVELRPCDFTAAKQ